MAMHPTADVKSNLGAILLGGLVSMVLSGVVACQTFLFFRIYSDDKLKIRLLVWLVWVMDCVHSALIAAALWKYFALGYGDKDQTDNVNLETALTLAFTAVITLIVHLFFASRVFRLSRSNWWCTAPIAALAFCRLAAAIASTYELGRLHRYTAFSEQYKWVFTLVLALSAVLDISIAAETGWYLQTSRTGFHSMDHLIDVLLLYTFNNGALPSIATVASLICWLAMSDNLVFLGIHFSVAKLYAMSLLITLNTRHSVHRRSRCQEGDSPHLPVFLSSSIGRLGGKHAFPSKAAKSRHGQSAEPTSTQVSVNVERTVHFDFAPGETVEDDCGGHPMQVAGDKPPTSPGLLNCNDDLEKTPSSI
ncbi:unnamed protein product [Peniophora sp. CBMAI 1063]|nr:unnamed protein product [Peniophora sp. CBMAI 1063]